ncbi:transketolase [Anaerolineales bacterium]
MSKALDSQAVNAIRFLSIDAVQKANSGHPGLPMGAASMAYSLWTQHMAYNPKNPHWVNRDRFVLSAGHGSMLLYSLLYLTGFDLSLDDIKNFRQWGSKTAGHPEYGHTPGVETTTGPLGQGVGNAVGFALAEAFLASTFNRPDHEIVDHYTFVIAGDGDMMEGVTIEACALAGHWGLGKLILLYDDNHITLDGEAKMTLTEDVPARFRAMGWHTLSVSDGNNLEQINEAINAAKAQKDAPTLISVRTIIGFGSPHKAGTSAAHGSPLGVDEIALTRQTLGWEYPAFEVPEEVINHYRQAVARGAEAEKAWDAKYQAWRQEYPALALEWDAAHAGVAEDWEGTLPSFSDEKPMATRNASGIVLNAIAAEFPTMIGGDADLAGSTKTLIKGAENTGPNHPAARNIRFGVREHGMAAIVNGLAVHGGIIKPYTATFLTFSDYMRPSIRLAALMDIPSVFVFTHDSIGLGEDGPTHQPVEHLMSLRLIPNLFVFRPADATETAGAWRSAMQLDHPTALIFSRQDLPVLAGNDEGIHAGVSLGAYVLVDSEDEEPEVILMATGSEVSIALEAYDALTEGGVSARVVSMPCWELFDLQDDEYKDSVLPPEVAARVSIEAGVTTGWQKYLGDYGIAIGVDRFGASAPYEKIYEEYGLTADHIIEAVRYLLEDADEQ